MRHLSAYASKRMAQFEAMSVEGVVMWALGFFAAATTFGAAFIVAAAVKSPVGFGVCLVAFIASGVWLVLTVKVAEKKISAEHRYMNLCDSRPAQIELREVKS